MMRKIQRVLSLIVSMVKVMEKCPTCKASLPMVANEMYDIASED